MNLAEGGDDLRIGDGVTHAQPGQPVRLREGAQHHEVAELASEFECVVRLSRRQAQVLEVRLVERDDDVGRHALQELPQVGCLDHGPGRVVRIAHEDQPRTVGDRVGHRAQVVGQIAGERDLDRCRARDARRQGIGLEGPPPEDHLVARSAGDEDEVLAEDDRPASHLDLVFGDPEALGQRCGQLHHPVVGVAVHGCGRRADRLDDARQRTFGDLVAGELHRSRKRLARYVYGKVVQVGADSQAHPTNVGRDPDEAETGSDQPVCLWTRRVCNLSTRQFERTPPRRRARAAEWDSLLMSCLAKTGPEVQILSPPPPQSASTAEN